jgi:redox-sensitive bicupin YhaK (pirin superfamily)
MGNRETFDSPGFQWMSVGSGIEHAEGGGTPAGQRTHGFQIWLKMPRARMDDDPVGWRAIRRAAPKATLE